MPSYIFTPLKVPYFERFGPLNKKEPAEGLFSISVCSIPYVWLLVTTN